MESPQLAPRQSGAAADGISAAQYQSGRALQDRGGPWPVGNKGTSAHVDGEEPAQQEESPTGPLYAPVTDGRAAILPSPTAHSPHQAQADKGASSSPTALGDNEDDGEDDWLLDSDDDVPGPAHGHAISTPARLPLSMEHRDWERVHARFHDQGYKEGITSGKLSTLQAGFDAGFGGAGGGAELGRRVGLLRGTVGGMLGVLPVRGTIEGSGAGGLRRRGGTRKGDVAGGAEKEHEELARRLEALHAELAALDVESVAEPDWEAIEHAKTHGAEDEVSEAARSDAVLDGQERQRQRELREEGLRTLEERVETLRDEVLRTVRKAS